MITSIQRKRTSFGYRIFSAFIAFTFIFSSIISPRLVRAQTVLNLPAPGTMIPLSASFNPAIVKGIILYPDNPLKFDFIIDPGDDNLQGKALKKEADKLIKYFMAALTVPEDEMWVNLSPYEKDRIIADGLSKTELGRDLLAQDYILKQLTASLMSPEEKLGKDFWDKVYAKAQERYGTSEIPMDTFNKVWIVPEKANVYVNGNNIFVVDNHLKVMLEKDYLALNSNLGHNRHAVGEIPENQIREINDVLSEIIREVLIPEIEREVNEGKNFANLRQVFNSMILATWYKQNLRESLLGQVYVNQNKVDGIDLEDKQIKEKIYNRYVEAFEKGVYNYIKEDYDEATQQIIPRKYFSGGIKGIQHVGSSPIQQSERGDVLSGREKVFTVENQKIDRAMNHLNLVSSTGGNKLSAGLVGENGFQDTAASPILSNKVVIGVDLGGTHNRVAFIRLDDNGDLVLGEEGLIFSETRKRTVMDYRAKAEGKKEIYRSLIADSILDMILKGAKELESQGWEVERRVGVSSNGEFNSDGSKWGDFREVTDIYDVRLFMLLNNMLGGDWKVNVEDIENDGQIQGHFIAQKYVDNQKYQNGKIIYLVAGTGLGGGGYDVNNGVLYSMPSILPYFKLNDGEYVDNYLSGREAFKRMTQEYYGREMEGKEVNQLAQTGVFSLIWSVTR